MFLCFFSTEQENVGFLQKFTRIHKMLIFARKMVLKNHILKYIWFFKKVNFQEDYH
jgi:hypothetical protein